MAEKDRGNDIIAGTKIGGQRCAATNKTRHGSEFYIRLGRLGGSACVPKGFALNREHASRAGYLGGRISRRGPNKLAEKQRREIHKAYKELMAIHVKAIRADEGAITVYDRKIGLVRGQTA